MSADEKSSAPTPAKKAGPSVMDRAEKGAKWFLLIAVVAVVVWFVYLSASAFLPRWWAQHVADRVDGRFSAGILWGVGYGFTSTIVALMLLFHMRRSYLKVWGRLIVLVLAVVALTPDLMTLAIKMGNSKSSQAAERTLDVMAPAFRSAMVGGVVAAVVLFLVISFLLWQVRSKKRQVEGLLATGTTVANTVTGKNFEAPELTVGQANKYRKSLKERRAARKARKAAEGK